MAFNNGKKKFEQKENKGSMFFNDHKRKPSDRDFQGTINVEGTVYWISGWQNTTKGGADYIGLSVQKQEEDRDSNPRGNFRNEESGPKRAWGSR